MILTIIGQKQAQDLGSTYMGVEDMKETNGVLRGHGRLCRAIQEHTGAIGDQTGPYHKGQ